MQKMKRQKYWWRNSQKNDSGECNFITVKDREPAIDESQEKDRGQETSESPQHRVPMPWREAGTQDGDEIKLAEIQVEVGDEILGMYGNEILEMCG